MSAETEELERLATLIRGVDGSLQGTALKRNALLQACLGARHRKQFFIPSGRALARRGNTIFNVVMAIRVELGRLPGVDAWQALCLGNRPVSLDHIIRLDAVLKKIAAHADEDVQKATLVNGTPFALADDSVVPSIWFADPGQFRAARLEEQQSDEIRPSKRQQLSREIFGAPRTLDIIEGHEKGDKLPRVTKAFLDEIATVLGSHVADVFDFAPHLGPRKGEATFALEVNDGNILE